MIPDPSAKGAEENMTERFGPRTEPPQLVFSIEPSIFGGRFGPVKRADPVIESVTPWSGGHGMTAAR
jgi:hypothetical protein